jgi:hypothetical protein
MTQVGSNLNPPQDSSVALQRCETHKKEIRADPPHHPRTECIFFCVPFKDIMQSTVILSRVLAHFTPVILGFFYRIDCACWPVS